MEYIATNYDDAHQFILDNSERYHVPHSVEDFLLQALIAVKDADGVYVRATGHLYTGEENSYPYSSAQIEVRPIIRV